MSDIVVIIPRDSFKNLNDNYKAFAEVTKQTIIDVLKEEGALTCREAMIFSPPVDGYSGGKGLTKEAEKWGNKAVEKDIRSFVSAKDKILSLNLNSQSEFNRWKNTVNPSLDKSDSIIAKIRRDANIKRAYQAAKNLLANKPERNIQYFKTEAELRAKHNELRGLYKGRIRRNGGPKLMQPFIADEKLIKNYIKLRQKQVGWMKSGWYDAIKKIGPAKINGMEKNFGIKGLTNYITRHINPNGDVGLDIGASSNGKVYLTIRNNVGNVFRIAELADVRNKVIFSRGEKMFKRMDHFISAAIDKTNKGIKPS